MKPYRYLHLNADIDALSAGFKNGSSDHFRTRCHSLLLSREGMKITEVAALYHKQPASIRKWITNFEKYGISGLHIQPGRGRKGTLSTENAGDVAVVKKKS